MTLIVCGLAEVPGLIAARAPSHVITLLDSASMIPTPKGMPPERHLKLSVNDIYFKPNPADKYGPASGLAEDVLPRRPEEVDETPAAKKGTPAAKRPKRAPPIRRAQRQTPCQTPPTGAKAARNSTTGRL